MEKKQFNAINELFWISENIVSHFIKDIKAGRHFFKEKAMAKDVSIKEENDIFTVTWIFILFELQKIMELYSQKKNKHVLDVFASNVSHASALALKKDGSEQKEAFLKQCAEQTTNYDRIIKSGEDYKKLFHEFLGNLHEEKEDFLDNIATDIGFFEGAYLWVLEYRILLKRIFNKTDDFTTLSKEEFEDRIKEAQKDTKKIASEIKKSRA